MQDQYVTDYLSSVRAVTDDGLMIRAAEALLASADASGVVQGDAGEIITEATDNELTIQGLGPVLSKAGLIRQKKESDGKRVTILTLPASTSTPPPVSTPQRIEPEPTKKIESKETRAANSSRPPKDQNEYASRVWNDYYLTSSQKLVALGLAIEFGYERGKTGKPFSQCTTEAAVVYVMGHAKLGERAARENLAKLVELGWLRRLDNGKGGRGGKGKGTYMPTLPS